MKIKSFNIFLFIVICNLIIISTPAYSQSTKKPVKISFGDYKGYASFDYELKGKDSLLNGKFSFEGPIIDTFDLKHNEYFSFNGNFNNNKPVGSWEFILTNVKGYNKTVLNNDYLQININVLKHQINGSFTSENINWKHQIYSRYNNQNIDTVYSSNIKEISKNRNSLNIQTKDLQLNAQIGENNLADSIWEWKLKNDTSTLYWEFKNGVLTKIYSDSLEWDIYEEKNAEASKISKLELSRKYIEILKIKILISGCWEGNKSSISIINTLDSIESIRRILLETLNGNYYSPLNFKLPFYELKGSEENKLNKVLEAKLEMDSIFSSLKQIKNTTEFKKGFPEVIPLMDSIKLIYLNQYNVINEITQIYNAGLLPYFNRNELTSYFINNLDNTESLKKDTIFELSSLVDLGRNYLQKVKRINSKIVYYNNKREKQKELLEIEKLMLSKKKIFDISLDSTFQITPKQYHNALFTLKEFSDSLITKYWATHSILQKLLQAEKNSVCFNNLFKLTQTISILPIEENKIINLYTDSSFNVFTSTNMEFLIKKKIVSAYTENLIPHFYELIISDLSCDNVLNIDKIIVNTNYRMYQMREENTKKIESKLNPKSPIKEVLELFGISPVFE